MDESFFILFPRNVMARLFKDKHSIFRTAKESSENRKSSDKSFNGGSPQKGKKVDASSKVVPGEKMVS